MHALHALPGWANLPAYQRAHRRGGSKTAAPGTVRMLLPQDVQAYTMCSLGSPFLPHPMRPPLCTLPALT